MEKVSLFIYVSFYCFAMKGKIFRAQIELGDDWDK